MHRTLSLHGLSYRFAVRCDDERLGRHVDALLAGLLAPERAAPVDHWYTLTVATGRCTVDVTRDGEPLALDQCPGDALEWLVWDVNRSAAEASGHHLLFHAGALDADGIGVLLPGASGSGKSTLVAGLARAGLGYLTDELAALDLTQGELLPYAKPITVKAGSFAVLADMDPLRDGVPGPGPGEEWQVPVGADTGRRLGRPCAPGLVIVPRYVAGAATRVTPLSDTEAFFYLALHAVNLLPHGAAGGVAVGRLAAQCSSYALDDVGPGRSMRGRARPGGGDCGSGARGSRSCPLTGRAVSRRRCGATAPLRSSWTTTWLSTTRWGNFSSS